MRRRITALVAATTSVVLLAFLVPAAVLVMQVARANGETRAQTALQGLVPLVAVDDAGIADAVDRVAGDGFAAWVVEDARVVAGADPTGGRLSVPRTTNAVLHVDEGTLFVQPVTVQGVVRTVFVLAPTAELTQGVVRIWVVLGVLGVLLFAAALLVADRIARGIARPVVELAGVAGELEGGDLAARVDPAGPREVHDVGVALNRLARRITDLLAAEREAAADLSHTLRTPVTALRLEAGSLADDTERVRIQGAVDDLDRAVDAVIREARRPVLEDLGEDPRADAVEVVRTRLTFWSVLAREEDRAVSSDLPDAPVFVRVAAPELGSTLDALLGNVFAHTAPGTAFGVDVREVGDAVEVVVGDDGPGLASADVLTRGESGGGSTGLGLSIARRTAENAGGGLTLRRRPTGGLEVVLTLAPA
ncbi:HAMP domain-containing sensor histidine kinase [Jatrophihabitans sp. YIM 134969]